MSKLSALPANVTIHSSYENIGIIWGLPGFERTSGKLYVKNVKQLMQGFAAVDIWDVWVVLDSSEWFIAFVFAVGICVLASWVSLVYGWMAECAAARAIYIKVFTCIHA
jgi:hypothetical protein